MEKTREERIAEILAAVREGRPIPLATSYRESQLAGRNLIARRLLSVAIEPANCDATNGVDERHDR